jgi:hypothetical protein
LLQELTPERVHSALRDNNDSDLTKQKADDDDTLVDPSVFSTQHRTSSAEDTLVDADPSLMEPASFSMYSYHKWPAGVPEDDRTDVESILSRDDISEAGTTASMVAYQHTATDIIKNELLGDSELSRTYSEAIGRVGQSRFLRNNRRFLQWLSEDLKTSQLLPSERMAVRFLGKYKGSRLVSAAICHDLIASKIGHGKQSRLEPNEDKNMMLNRFLSQMDSAEQHWDNSKASHSDDGDGNVMSSGDENDDEDSEEERTEKLEATVKFLVSGQPFQVYKQRLHEWLYPTLRAHARKQDDATNTSSSPEDVVFETGLTVPNENWDVLTGGEASIRYTENGTNQTNDHTLSGTKETAPPIPPGERDNPSHHELLEESLGIVVASQQKTTLQYPMFASSLPLLVDTILRHLPLPILEPTVSVGKVRVYWTPVRCSVQLV